MWNVLVLPMCKADSFGGIQSFVTTLIREAERSSYTGITYQLPRGEWLNEPGVLRDLLGVQRFDLIHSHNLHLDARNPIASIVQDLAAEHGIPHVLTVHDVPSFESVRHVLLGLRKSFLVTQSNYNRARLQMMTGRRVSVLPICIDFPETPLCTEPEPLTLAYPGRLAPYKGGLLAIAAAGLVASRVGSVRLLFSDSRRWSHGQTQAFLDSLHDAAARTAGVEIEFLEDPGVVPRIYRRAMATLALPQRPEGFGMTPLESLTHGCPVVAVPNGGMSEWLTGLPGVAIATGGQQCEEPIAAAIVDVLQNHSRYREGAWVARDLLRARYAPAPVLSMHRDVYDSARLRLQQGCDQ